jgi:hypothetical protein
MLQRFNIGVYQIWQARRPDADDEQRRSGHVAVALHLIAAAETLGADVAKLLPDHLEDHPLLRWDNEVALLSIAFLTQQYCYATWCKPGTVRHSRVNKDNVAWHTAGLVSLSLGQLDVAERRQGLHEEAERIKSLEWRRK